MYYFSHTLWDLHPPLESIGFTVKVGDSLLQWTLASLSTHSLLSLPIISLIAPHPTPHSSITLPLSQ